ncbi:MAG: hypothetical protein IKO49_00825 [Bacilli bacterium]|nr:hypothetical protein [Bacilli bacterium]
MDNNKYNSMTLEEFAKKYDSSRDKDVPEMKKMFLSMDKKIKLYHEHNYVINSFRVQDIVIYQSIDNNGEIKYDTDFKEVVSSNESTNYTANDNIFYAACLAIGIYNNCLSYINPENPVFLKNNFSLFAENMPLEVVPYYRGVIERGATVYLSEFIEAKEKQEIDRMRAEAEFEEERLAKKSEIKKDPRASVKNETWGTRDAAFSSIALFPILIALLGVIIPIIFSFMS